VIRDSNLSNKQDLVQKIIGTKAWTEGNIACMDPKHKERESPFYAGSMLQVDREDCECSKRTSRQKKTEEDFTICYRCFEFAFLNGGLECLCGTKRKWATVRWKGTLSGK